MVYVGFEAKFAVGAHPEAADRGAAIKAAQTTAKTRA